MPLGKWSSFGQCVGAQKRMGHSDESARKICGSIQAETEGASSQDTKYGANAMSQQMDKPPGAEDGGQGNVSVPKDKAEALVSAIMNDDLQTAKRIAADIFNIEEEDAAPNKPPAKPSGRPGFPPR
jgi:dsRNA-specific ribonuclease